MKHTLAIDATFHVAFSLVLSNDINHSHSFLIEVLRSSHKLGGRQQALMTGQ
ncbi:hypothetical protein [Comamonas sp. GB3 AK4-5]|uniref:hypothetical protein n=1 Tax=Comamonas sp. GB3 AK4-5 TaxID=3231487 RepID=UPI00351EFCF3